MLREFYPRGTARDMCRDRDPLAVVGASVEGCDGGDPAPERTTNTRSGSRPTAAVVEITRQRELGKLNDSRFAIGTPLSSSVARSRRESCRMRSLPPRASVGDRLGASRVRSLCSPLCALDSPRAFPPLRTYRGRQPYSDLPWDIVDVVQANQHAARGTRSGAQSGAPGVEHGGACQEQRCLVLKPSSMTWLVPS